MPMLIAPAAATYATRVPYITAAEFKAHPTGTETNNLVPGGSAGQQTQALQNIINRASSYADEICDMVLAATLDTHIEKCRVAYDGSVKITLDYGPVIGVVAVNMGLTPQSLVSADPSTGYLAGERILQMPTTFIGPGPYYTPGELYTQTSYINGYANAQLAAPAIAGATTLQLNNALGVMPGQTLALNSGTATEAVTVSPAFTPVTTAGPATVTLAAPTVNAYGTGDTFTALPQSIKLAVILIATAIIKTKGGRAFTMGHTRDQPGTEEKLADLTGEELGMAMELLHNHVRRF